MPNATTIVPILWAGAATTIDNGLKQGIVQGVEKRVSEAYQNAGFARLSARLDGISIKQ